MVFWKDPEANKLLSVQEFTVDQVNGDFQKIKDCCDYVLANFDVNERVIIKINAPIGVNGKYQEDNPITVKPNTEIVGQGNLAIVVEALNSGSNLFETSTTGGNNAFSKLLLSGTDSTHSCIKMQGSGGINGVNDVTFNSCGVGIELANAGTVVTINGCNGVGGCETVVKATAGVGFCFNILGLSNVNTFIADATVLFVTGSRALSASGSFMLARNSGLIINTNNTALACDKGGRVETGGSIQGNGFFAASSTTYDLDQSDSSSNIIMSSVIGNTNKFNISLDTGFIVTSVFDAAVGGQRYKKNSYAANANVTPSEQLSAVTAGAVTLTLPTVNGGGLNGPYPPILEFVDESGLGTSFIAVAGGDTIDGGAGPVAIPATGSLRVYALPTGWRTLS